MAPTSDDKLMDELFGSSSGSEAEDEADNDACLVPDAAAAAAGAGAGPTSRVDAAAPAAAVATAAGKSRLGTLNAGLPLDPDPELEPSAQLAESLLQAALVDARSDDSLAASLFQHWPLVALVRLPDVGGGRGVVTTQAVSAGTVLMSEAPFIPPPLGGWAEAVQSGSNFESQTACKESEEPAPLHTAVAHLLLATGNIRCREMQELHPQSLDPEAGCLTASQLERSWKEHTSTVDELLGRYPRPPCKTSAGAGADSAGSRACGASDGPYSREEVLRCVLAVQFNAFGSGLYLALAMINHSCRPNASKFEPRRKTAAKADAGAASTNVTGKSEIVAVVDIPCGAEVTIHYANPIMRSHRSRVALFEAQHQFTLSETSPFDAIDPRLDMAVSPESSWVITSSVERRLDRLDARIETEAAGTAQSLEEARSCLKAALDVLPPQHLVVVRSHLAVVRAAQAVITATEHRRSTRKSSMQKRPNAHEGKDKQCVAHVAAVCALRSCVAVGESRYLPASHHDRATTAADTASLLAYLLSVNPELLYRELAAEGFGTFSLASRAEFAAKQRADALQAVYRTASAD